MARRMDNPQIEQRLKALLKALRDTAPNTELVGRRAQLLMGIADSRIDRLEWLRSILPEPWHFEKVTEALGMVRVGAADSPLVAEPETPPVQSPRRHRRVSRASR